MSRNKILLVLFCFLVVQVIGIDLDSKYFNGFNTQTNCPQWSVLEGQWLKIITTNATAINYEVSYSVQSSKKLEKDQEYYVKNILDSVNVKGLTYNGKYYPYDVQYAISSFQMMRKSSFLVTFQNNENQIQNIFRWVIKGVIKDSYFDVSFQTMGIMALPLGYLPKCPLGFCEDSLCQKCVSSPQKVYDFCDKRGCSISDNYACLTPDFSCNKNFVNYSSLDDGTKQVIDCRQQKEECDNDQYGITTIPIQDPECVQNPNQTSCLEYNFGIVPYYICCKNNPFISRLCLTEDTYSQNIFVINYVFLISLYFIYS